MAGRDEEWARCLAGPDDERPGPHSLALCHGQAMGGAGSLSRAGGRSSLSKGSGHPGIPSSAVPAMGSAPCSGDTCPPSCSIPGLAEPGAAGAGAAGVRFCTGHLVSTFLCCRQRPWFWADSLAPAAGPPCRQAQQGSESSGHSGAGVSQAGPASHSLSGWLEADQSRFPPSGCRGAQHTYHLRVSSGMTCPPGCACCTQAHWCPLGSRWCP